MSTDPAPEPGDWISFHPSTPGRAERGQVTEQLGTNQWGRRLCRVAYRREVRRGKRLEVETATDTVPADRIIHRCPAPNEGDPK